VLFPEFEGRDGGNDNDVDDEFDDDPETVKGMARLFCEVAEAYIQLILAATPQVWAQAGVRLAGLGVAWRRNVVCCSRVTDCLGASPQTAKCAGRHGARTERLQR
jgi:hypothetical protein